MPHAYRAARAVLQADCNPTDARFTMWMIHSENWFPPAAIML